MWRILKWTFIVTAWLAGTGFITLVASVSDRMRQEMLAQQRVERARELERQQAAAAFARLGPSDRALAIYDAFCRGITDNYFDPNYSGVDWAAVKKEWRPKAAGARDDRQLYDEVLSPITAMFPVSHLTLNYTVAAADRAEVHGPRKLAIEGTGLVPAVIQRGGQRMLVVDDVVRGSPAEFAGVAPGWFIDKWKDGTAPKVLAVSFLRPGTPEQMLQAQESLTFNLPAGLKTPEEQRAWVDRVRITLDIPVQERPPRPSFAVRKYPGGLLYVNLVSFSDPPTLDRMFDALDDSSAALILDLRHNSGGFLTEIARFAERMLPPDTLYGYVIEKGRRLEERTSAKARGFDRPVIALIGPSTYSAGEVAAAIVRLKSAPLVGSMTAGAVLVSHAVDLPDGGALSVPTSETTLPDGSQIEGKGVRPDIPVFATIEDVRAGRDAVLERALAELAAKPASKVARR